tara:strand:- start:13 stop:468 length:456 start_codon:yes stop_codon:yes gene_type:complete
MAYVKVANGASENYSLRKLRSDNPNISFPKDVPTSVLEEFNVYELTFEAQPDFDPDTQVAYENETPVLEKGKWLRKWTVVDKTSEELSSEVDLKISGTRDERNLLLSNSDWTQVDDSPVDKSSWATYRQALRDVPTQAGFPTDVTWPVEPS